MTTHEASEQQSREHGGRQQVVVAYDGSPGSAAALAWAAVEAGSRRARLRVVHAEDVDVEGISGAAPLAAALHEAAGRLAQEGAERARAVPGGPPPGDVEVDVPHGRPVPALVEASKDADLLVTGSRGYGSVAGALLGSVAFAVTAQAACPVVVVRGEDGRRAGPEHPVVVGVDGSDDAAAAVALAADAAAAAAAPLVVLTAWTPTVLPASGSAYVTSYSADLSRWAEEAAQRRLDAASAQAHQRRPDLEVDPRLVCDTPARALVAASTDAGLVVVGARGRGSVAGLFLGSVSHATIHGARCPVAVIRPAGA